MPESVGPRLLTLGLVGLLAGGALPQGGGTVVIGSKNFTENRLLAEIMAQLIEAHTDLSVDRRINLGGTTVVFSALRNGEIDVYPEYTGTGWIIHLGIGERVHQPLRAYTRVRREFLRRWNIQWLAPFGFSNSYAIAVAEGVGDSLRLETISDLADHQAAIRAGLSHEFLNREDGYPGLAAAYGLDLGDVRGMEHGLAYEALISGRVHVIDTWTTDGKLLRYPVRILEDDAGFFPPYHAAPIARREILDRHPELADLLNRLAYTIDDEAMQRLNYRVEEDGGPFADVAREFLRSEGLLADTLAAAGPGGQSRGLGDFVKARARPTLRLTVQHLWLTGVAVLLAIAIAVPVGIWLTRRRRLAGAVLGAAGVVQTVPSLALLAFMIPVPWLGLGARSAIAALFLYALLPILRNTVTGINGVDADLLEAARGMGLTNRQILTRVELPLATATIMAGIRTSTVISIGIATLAAFIGAGGLGDPIVTGLQLNDSRLILAGAIPAAALALIVDGLLGRAERWLVPKGLG